MSSESAYFIYFSMNNSNCHKAIYGCIFLGVIYVGSLYIWRTRTHRDHPLTIKKRFISVLIMTLMSILFAAYGTDFSYFKGDPELLSLLGFRCIGFFRALIIPLLLTMVLFSGPLTLHYLDGVCSLYLESKYWVNNCRNLIWVRNHIVAPFSEEFTFRACMLPILVPCFGISSSIFLCPLFFGVAHLHHLRERLETGASYFQAICQSLFQFGYTTAFGAYSAYLFLRTGHFIAPFIVHAFCNHMGFPDFSEVFGYRQPMRTVLIVIFIAGFISWLLLLPHVTEPKIYGNTIYS